MSKHRLVGILAIITSIGAYLMLLMGAIVTKTGSGKGCGTSWPICHGQLIPDALPIATVLEYSHRIISGADGLLILALFVIALVFYRKDRLTVLFAAMSLFFVVLQGALGALTVVFEGTFAKKALLAFHFGFSLISFASVILLTVHLFKLQRAGELRQAQEGVKPAVSRGINLGIWGLTIYTYIVVYTGALVRHADATLACGTQFPGCSVAALPGFSSPAGIQMLHRLSGISLWLVTLWLLVVIVMNHREIRGVVRPAWLAFGLITLQAITGITTVFTGGQLVAALIHTTIISVYFSVLCYLCVQIGLPWSKQSVKEQEPVAVLDGEKAVSRG